MYPNLKTTCHIKLKIFLENQTPRELTSCKLSHICRCDFNAQHSEKLHNLHNDLPFLPERMKMEKVEKLVAILHDKKEYVIHISIKAWISIEKSA